MSVEELLEKYKGAYASDFEAPSGSGSKESSDSEVSGDEEEETEEDESDVESNSSSSGINHSQRFSNNLVYIVYLTHLFLHIKKKQFAAFKLLKLNIK